MGNLTTIRKNLSNLKVIIRNYKSGLDTAHKFAHEYAKK